MGDVLRLRVAEPAEFSIRIMPYEALESDIAFLEFGTSHIEINGSEGVFLHTTLLVDELDSTTYIRDKVITSDHCPYMESRPGLIDLSRKQVAISPTLRKHIGTRNRIMVIDNVLLHGPDDSVDGHIALLKKIAEVHSKKALVVILDWHSMMQSMSDVDLPSPDYIANSAGYRNTGLFWICNS
jgi:hypothetical protein